MAKSILGMGGCVHFCCLNIFFLCTKSSEGSPWKETSSLDTKSAVQFREFFNLYFLFISSPVLQALKDQVIKECVVGPRHVAFLLEVSNTEFSIKKMI